MRRQGTGAVLCMRHRAAAPVSFLASEDPGEGDHSGPRVLVSGLFLGMLPLPWAGEGPRL